MNENQAMLESKELGQRLGIAITDAAGRLGLSQAKLAVQHFKTTPQALNGWKTTGQIDVRNFVLLGVLSGRDFSFFFSGKPAASTSSDHGVVQQLDGAISKGLLTEDQLQRISDNIKDCAELTAAKRSLALSKSPGVYKKRA